ncbi:MAG TPA: NAD(P)-dependent oxidoreductase [Anaerolineales bacterium]
MPALTKVGFIGLGLMGAPMAANIARAGYPLTVYNRSADKAKPLLALGASLADTPAALAAASNVVISMLADAAAVHQVAFGAGGLTSIPGGCLTDMSTIAPDQSQEHARRLAEHGWSMIDAPVIGSTGPAEAGTLGILSGGELDLVEQHRDLLETLGALHYLGAQGAGALAKMCFNLMVAAQVGSLAEAMFLGAAGGLDIGQLADIISGSGIASSLIQRKAANMVAGDFPPAFPLNHMQKDLGLMIRTSDRLGAFLPGTASYHQLYSAARGKGMGDLDFSAVYRFLVGAVSNGQPAASSDLRGD